MIKNSFKKVDSSQLLHSRAALYILAIVSLIQIIYFASAKDINAMFIFLIVGFLTSFFSKNMVVILFVALIITHLLRCDIRKSNYEGAENMDDEKNMDGEKKMDSATPAAADMKAPPDVVAAAKNSAEISIEANDAKKLADAEKKKELYDKLKADFVEFQTIQKDILAGMKEIDPLLNKAESFISKFESFGKEFKKQ
jgi:hypothetical protein